MSRFWDWLVEDLTWGGVFFASGLFVATFVLSILVVGFLLVRLPATFFLDSHCRDLWVDQHPVLRTLGHILKNLIGVALIVVGVIMLVGPGQGILTILIGVILLDFPGKRQLERKLVARPKVLAAINRLRARFGRPPLVLDEKTKEPPVEAGGSAASSGVDSHQSVKP